MDKRTQKLGEIKKEMEREDDALYAIKNKMRHLEDVEGVFIKLDAKWMTSFVI